MIQVFKKFMVIVVVLFLFNCEQIIEVEDISNEHIVVLSPVNNTTLTSTEVNFTWEPLDFAEQYQLQIVHPNFEAAEVFVEDTIITANSFIKPLVTNTYQWRVRALNFAYETQYTTQNLTIEDQ